MKIGILGNYGATNVGDDAILTAILKSLSHHKVTVFSSNPQETHRQFGIHSVSLFPLGIRSCIKNGFRKSIKALKELDLVILGGGGLFQDSYLFAVFLWAWQIFWIRFFNKPLFIYGAGVGPLKTWLGKKITKWAYNQAEYITVRDHYSKNLLHKLGIPENEIQLTTDPAFSYRQTELLKERSINTYIISLRPWLKYNKKIIRVMTSFLERLKKEKNAEFIFVCMQGIKEHDRQIIDPIIRKVGGELYIPRHFSDLLQIMQTAEFAIGMRYHFLIAAMLTQTPALSISYSPKVDELFQGTPLETHLIKVSEISADNLYNRLKKLSVDYNNVKIYQKSRVNVLAGLADNNADLFTQFLKTFDGN